VANLSFVAGRRAAVILMAAATAVGAGGCVSVHLGEPAQGGIYDQARHDGPGPDDHPGWIHINSDEFR